MSPTLKLAFPTAVRARKPDEISEMAERIGVS
jgi:hypothetical protein